MDEEEKDDEITRLRSLLDTTERDKRRIERELTAARTKEEESADVLAEEKRKVAHRTVPGDKQPQHQEQRPSRSSIQRMGK